MNILLGLELIILLKSVRSLTLKSERFEVLNGSRISSGHKTLVYNVFGRIHCAMMCLQANTCYTASFDFSTHTCELTIETVETTNIDQKQNWEILRPSLDDAWKLVFRATAGIGFAVYDAWIGTLSLPVATEPCKSIQSSSCLTHYRSPVLDHWTTNNITQVRFSLYKNNAMVVNIIFRNLAEDDNTRWFSKDRLIKSSYSDMTSTSQYNRFSVMGVDDGKVLRRFYISNAWRECPADIGWIAVFDAAGVCPYEIGHQYPYFGYAPNNLKGTVLDFQSADVLAVFINQD